jgi:phage shock protein A
MSVFDRIRRIAGANINWLLDKAEVPEKELESKIKELGETIQEGRESAAAYCATFRRLEHEYESLRQQEQELTRRAAQSLKAQDEATARQALTEKVALAERAAQIQPGIEKGRKTFEMLRDNLVRLQEQLKSAKLKLADLKARKRTAEAQKAFDQHLGKTIGLGDGVAFDRLEDEVLQTEAEVEIRQEMHGDALSDIELAQRSRELQVEAELQAMKDQLADES